MFSVQNSGYQPPGTERIHMNNFWVIYVHNDTASKKIQLQQKGLILYTLVYILGKPRSAYQPSKGRFCTIHTSV